MPYTFVDCATFYTFSYASIEANSLMCTASRTVDSLQAAFWGWRQECWLKRTSCSCARWMHLRMAAVNSSVIKGRHRGILLECATTRPLECLGSVEVVSCIRFPQLFAELENNFGGNSVLSTRSAKTEKAVAAIKPWLFSSFAILRASEKSF